MSVPVKRRKQSHRTANDRVAMFRSSFECEFTLAACEAAAFDQSLDSPLVAVIKKLPFIWQLQLYPKGYTEAAERDEASGLPHRDFVAVFLAYVNGAPEEVNANYEVHLCRSDGSYTLILQVGLGAFQVSGCMLGGDTLVRVSDIPANYRRWTDSGDEVIRLRCTLDVSSACCDPLRQLAPAPRPVDNLAEYIDGWSAGRRGFVTLVSAEGGEFSEHIDMLADNSTVFATEFDERNASLVEGATRRAVIDGIGTVALNEMLNFMRTRVFSKKHVTAHVLEILDGAERYQLKELKTECERVIIEKLQAESVASLSGMEFLDLLAVCETYRLRLAKRVGLCRLFERYQHFGVEEQQRFDTAAFESCRRRFLALSSMASHVVKLPQPAVVDGSSLQPLQQPHALYDLANQIVNPIYIYDDTSSL